MKIIGRTHPGQVRPNNEDAFDYDVEAGVAVLADGMGGLNAGEVASTRTVAAVLEALASQHRTADGIHRNAEDLRDAVAVANRHVYELSREQRELRSLSLLAGLPPRVS